MKELQHLQTQDLSKETSAVGQSRGRTSSGQGVDLSAETMQQISRSPDSLLSRLADLKDLNPSVFQNILRAITETQGNAFVNRLLSQLEPAQEAPNRQGCVAKGHQSFHAAVSRGRAVFDALFGPDLRGVTEPLLTDSNQYTLKSPRPLSDPRRTPSVPLADILSSESSSSLPERALLERALCRDLSNVKVYQGSDVDAVLCSRQAKGAAIGKCILLGPNPALATVVEEVIHTCQQPALSPQDLSALDTLPSSRSSDPCEREAAHITQQLLANQPLDPIKEKSSVHFARQAPEQGPITPRDLPNQTQNLQSLQEILARCDADSSACRILIQQHLQAAMDATAADDPIFDLLLDYQILIEQMEATRCTLSQETGDAPCADLQALQKTLDQQTTNEIQRQVETLERISEFCIGVVVIPHKIRPFFRHPIYCGDPFKLILDDMHGISDRKIDPIEAQLLIDHLLKLTDIERSLLLNVHTLASRIDNDNTSVTLKSLQMYDQYSAHLDAAATILQTQAGNYAGVTCSRDKFYDENVWRASPETEMENIFCKLTPQDGISPSNAIDRIFQEPTAWQFDCAQYVQVLNLYALKQSMGASAFDAYVQQQLDGKLDFYQQNTPALLPGGQKVGYYRKAPGSQLTPNVDFLPPLSSDQDALDQAPAGSRIMWTCAVLQHIEALLSVHDPYTHENAVKISNGTPSSGADNLFSAQFGTVQHRISIEALLQSYLESCVGNVKYHAESIIKINDDQAREIMDYIDKKDSELIDYVKRSIFLSEIQFYTKPIDTWE